MHNIAVNLSDNTEEDKIEDKTEDNKIDEDSTPEPEDGYNLERQIKIGRTKTLVNENVNKITNNIIEMHREYSLKKYVDIYITFRNQLVTNLIHDIYNRGIIIRLFYNISCQKKKIEKYYYKNQWLHFYFAKENPSDIKWENFYISTCEKCGRRFLSILISFLFIFSVAIVMIIIKNVEDYYVFLSLILTNIINLGSSLVLHKLTKFEKYSSDSKEIFSNISKFYWLNFLINLTVLCKKGNYTIFSYHDMEDYFIFNKIIIKNMLTTIGLSQLTTLIFYFWNILKRYSDSKYNNGKTTELNNKIKYQELYLGPDFPFEDRYGQILLNLSLCLLFGTNSPLIYFFFVGFLIVTFIVDKFLMIYYYKKPPLYGSLLSKKILNYFFLVLLIYIYGLIYNISNP